MTVEESKLIEKAKHGDEKAFKELYNKYYRLLRYIIYDIVKDDDVTADLLSITFIKAFKGINRFAENISFEAWLKTIASNTAIDFYRQKRRKQNDYSIDNEDNTLQLIDEDSDHEAEIIKAENINLLKEALSKLRKKYQNLLTLRYYQGLSYEELSVALNIPIGTVKSDLNKAKHKLRYYFQNISNSN